MLDQRERQRREEKSKKARQDAFVVPDFIDKDKWNALMEIRVAKKAVQSELALTAIVNKLKAMGDDADAALDNAIENSWKTVYPVKGGFMNREESQPYERKL